MSKDRELVQLVIPVEAFHVNHYIQKGQFQVDILTKNAKGTYDQAIQTYDGKNPFSDAFVEITMDKDHHVFLRTKKPVQEITEKKSSIEFNVEQDIVYRTFQGLYKNIPKKVKRNLKDDTILKYNSQVIVINLFEGTNKINYPNIPSGLSPATLAFLGARK
jgi:hypothetical protein